MKKEYIAPAVDLTVVCVENIMALSVFDKFGDPEEPALVVEENSWDINWAEE